MTQDVNKMKHEYLMKILQEQLLEYRHAETMCLNAFIVSVTIMGLAITFSLNYTATIYISLMSISLVGLVVATFLQRVAGHLRIRLANMRLQHILVQKHMVELGHFDIVDQIELNIRFIAPDEDRRQAKIKEDVKDARAQKSGFYDEFPDMLHEWCRVLAKYSGILAVVGAMLFGLTTVWSIYEIVSR
jgi:hypothetical protein